MTKAKQQADKFTNNFYAMFGVGVGFIGAGIYVGLSSYSHSVDWLLIWAGVIEIILAFALGRVKKSKK